MRCAATFDYIGISVLITASILTTEHYGFYCNPTLRTFYLTFTALTGLVPILCSFFTFWDTQPYRLFRVAVFILLGSSGIVPFYHQVEYKGFDAAWHFISPIFSSIAAYLAGVYIYANRFPERIWPGKLDRWGLHSHSVWHVMVCIGIYEHYRATLWFYSLRGECEA